MVYAERIRQSDLTEEELMKLIREKDYGDIQVKRRDGKTVHYTIEEVTKFK